MDTFIKTKYKALDEIAETEHIWKTKKSSKVLDLIKDINAAIKSENTDIVSQLCTELKKTNDKELQYRQQVQEVKTQLIHDIDLAETNYKENRTFEFTTVISEAKRLIKKQKSELSDLQATKTSLEKCLATAQNIANKNKKKALAEANKKALLANELLQNPDSISINLPKLANFPPDETGNNPYRPDWVDYDKKQNIWKVNSNALADDIADEYTLKRVEEKGKSSGYIGYYKSSGLWEPLTSEGLGNFINNYFSTPNKFSGSLSNQYAEDLQTAKVVKDTLTLLKTKIQKIEPQTTFDKPNKYLVHFQDTDFDVLSFERVHFDPTHYFLSGVNTSLNTGILERIQGVLSKVKLPVSSKHIIGSIAPVTKKWLLKSLGDDNDTLIAFLERLGLSMLHDYSDNFIVFIYGNANTGKSKLFNYLRSLFSDSSVSALDLDLLAKSGSFDTKELRFRTINLTSETKVTSIDETTLNVLEQLSGGDLRNYSQKFKDTADFVNFSHLWFNANELPQLAQFDNAFARRADIFNWHSIPNFEKEIDWEAVENERPQLILLALYYAHQVLTRTDYNHYDYCGNVDLRLSRSQDMINLYQDWVNDKDYFTNFVEENCQIKPSYKVGCGELLKSYNSFLKDLNEKPVTQKQLTKLLTRFKVFENKNQNWKDSKGKWHRNVYVYQGITTNETAGIQNEEISFEAQQYNAGAQRTKKIFG